LLEFPETVLCDLNRSIQDARGFECHAFQPVLELVGSPEKRVSGLNNGPTEDTRKESLFELLNSDRIKYKKALALQKLGRDPDGVYAQLKYHLCWNASLRRALFRPVNDLIESVHDHFLRCSEMVGGFVELLNLAPDHVHLYVESDGELSIEEMVQRIKGFTDEAMLEEFPSVRGSLGEDTGIWDKAYFVETLG